MIDNAIKKTILQKILNSKEFANSQVYRDLFTYLVEASIKGQIPKETTIAIDVLGRDKNFNPNDDPIVRVYLHRIRQKLEIYYAREGKKDSVRLEIPKGHYAVQFVSHSKSILNIVKKAANLTNVFFISFIIILIAVILIQWKQNRSLKPKSVDYQSKFSNNSIWSEFSQNDLPTLVVVGHNFFFNEYNENLQKWRWIRDPDINSDSDFELFKLRKPRFKLQKGDNVYYSSSIVWSLPKIFSVLKINNNKVELRRLRDLNPVDLDNYNILYLGNIKNLGLFNRYFQSSHFKYQLNPYGILYTPENADTTEIFTPTISGSSMNYHTDLAVILKFPGPKNNSILIITSFYVSGVIEAVECLTSSSSLAELEDNFFEKYNKIPQHFELLMEVRGLFTTGFSKEIKIVNEISLDYKIW